VRSSDTRTKDAGYVTAEAAVAIPTLILLVTVLLCGVVASAGYIQCVDAARTGARAAARGESPSAVRQAVRSAAPAGARLRTVREGDLVRVRVQARITGLDTFAVHMSADAVALAEDKVGADSDGGG
jgi:hypothetical protein